MIIDHFGRMSEKDLNELRQICGDYLDYRAEAGRFFQEHFAEICSRNCFANQLSACCTRDGIITFFGDLVVNALVSEPDELDRINKRLAGPRPDFAKCLYLADDGCLWRMKPLVCEMFLCDAAMESVFKDAEATEACWKRFKTRALAYRFPDRPVLFDHLEMAFLYAGYRSNLMYINTSPALRRIKARAGLPMVD